MSKLRVVDNYACDNCGNNNKELVIFEKQGWLWKSEIFICQTCISKAFRSFRKEK